jgi:hypothetical protein
VVRGKRIQNYNITIQTRPFAHSHWTSQGEEGRFHIENHFNKISGTIYQIEIPLLPPLTPPPFLPRIWVRHFASGLLPEKDSKNIYFAAF